MPLPQRPQPAGHTAPGSYVPGRLGSPPVPGAIRLAETSVLGRAGEWIDISSGDIHNLSSGMRLPMNAPRQIQSFAAAGITVPEVHDPTPIAGYLANYKNGRYLLDTVVQMQPVEFQQFKYRTFDKNNTYLVHDVRASGDSAPKEVKFSSALSNGATDDLRVGIFVPYRAENQGDFNVRMSAARKVWTAMALWREYSMFGSGGLLMTSGSWASSVRQALGGTDNWGPPGSEGATSDPIRDLQTACANSLEPITFFVMNLVQFQWFTRHPEVIAYFTAHNKGGNTVGMLSAASTAAGDPNATDPYEFNCPGVGKILVHNARATTDPSTAPSRIWSNDIVLGFAHSSTMPPNDDVASVVNFRLKNPTGGAAGGMIAGMPEVVPTNNGWTVRLVPVPLRGAGGDIMIVDLSERLVMTANDVGAYISGVS